ncbi:HAD-IIB family hydrolase [Sulfitobacter geojensis]|uniref:HAD-IIB family hydrolase n=1 Tax=Sulfitobacter geojensis TaxID=1342299 RepID=UPI0007D98A2F|nr:HAD hydrolase family protein [Sulfitobacter geojensis]OAN84939.1 mannosyl-3-phosphoglycerate phosphatase [Sulfitobacter geojensis]
MTSDMPLLVFTDLDGTLLSHGDYRWGEALPALERLAHIGAGVVLASSKTALEISDLRQEMGLQHWPAIVENGAGLLAPHAQAVADSFTYAQLRAVLGNIPANLRRGFCGFGDMDTAQVVRLTGLSASAAALAKQRGYSEPGTWSGTSHEKAQFLEELTKQGVVAREGGRFLTLSFGGTKADQMAQIIDELRPRHTIALGDAPNDAEMLESADFGVIVANPHGADLPLLEGEKAGRIMRTQLAGPQGWNAAIMGHLARLKL